MKAVKVALVGIGILSATAAFSDQPNHYSCVNQSEGVSFLYSASSLSGKPTYNLSLGGQQVVPAPNDKTVVAYDAKNTPLGRLVSAEVTRVFIADAPNLVYSVLIPGIQLGDHKSADFKTYLFQGYSGGYRALPAVYQGINRIVELTCTAEKVTF